MTYLGINTADRAREAWELRKQGLLLREIGVKLGKIRDGTPLSVDSARLLCNRGERMEASRQKIALI